MVFPTGIRNSAVCQVVLGVLCVIFGIVDRIFIYTNKHGKHVYYTEDVIAIWMGVWFVITGIFGYFMPDIEESGESQYSHDRQEPETCCRCQVYTYLGFSIVATVFALTLLICYSIGLSDMPSGSSCSDKQCRTSVGLGAMIIIFGVVEFGVGIWACISCYTENCCDFFLECFQCFFCD